MIDDLISRQAAIETILGCCPSDCDNEYECGYDDGLRQAVYRLKHLPSAQPERKKGRWNTDKESPEYATCSVCGHCDWDCTESEYFKYCPNCGAKMDEEEPEITEEDWHRDEWRDEWDERREDG